MPLLHRNLPFASVHATLDAVERPALRRFDPPASALTGYDALLAASARWAACPATGA